MIALLCVFTEYTIMDKLKRKLVRVAYMPDDRVATLSLLDRSFIHLLTAASHIYKLALAVRRQLYKWGIFSQRRLPVPVISVGNLTWGGNGKTPMTELLSLLFAEVGISPLILTRGYVGGDETRMLQRHLLDTSVKIGSGPDRATTASSFFQRYGVMDCQRKLDMAGDICLLKEIEMSASNVAEQIGIVILDDGMQHWSLSRDVEVVMVNCINLWGNGWMIPRGPLREPLKALRRADVIVLHHADLISNEKLQNIKVTLKQVLMKEVPIVCSRMVPCYFFRVKCYSSKVPLNAVHDMVVLCVSGIGCPDSFSLAIQKLGALHVDQLDFIDHHVFQDKDLKMIQKKLQKLKDNFGKDAIVVLTEKDYDRSQLMLTKLEAPDILVLHSTMQIMSSSGNPRASFGNLLLNKVIVQSSSNVRTLRDGRNTCSQNIE